MIEERCIFCDSVCITIKPIKELKNSFKEQNMEFTMNHSFFSFKIGKKHICSSCSLELRHAITESGNLNIFFNNQEEIERDNEDNGKSS